MTGTRPRLAFVSPVFLFPNDAGGKIRTTNILRGLKGGAFEITLLSPASQTQQLDWARELRSVCDRFVGWTPSALRPRWARAGDLLRTLPVNVVADRTPAALRSVAKVVAEQPDLVVFDFVHSAVLRPAVMNSASVCFTHNVEAEIFARHARTAGQSLMRRVWVSQASKMERYERESLRHFTSVVAVSDRDAKQFRDRYGLRAVHAIPTGVDLDFFSWRLPPRVTPQAPPTVVFTGSMDWEANVDGVRHFLSEVWPLVQHRVPGARFVVVGRHPPAALTELARERPEVSFTGFVDDVRPYVHAAHAFAIPLRVGGGTRIKAFEAMAMGCPVVSTRIGIEGLDVTDGEHFLCRDSAEAQADAVVELLTDAALREAISRQARHCVEERFGHRVAAGVFEGICLDALAKHRAST
ncbi:glycosyltransferase [uncultured Piscinibacter sp.]|uniref:glycosyltransferase n=1 Tax=uncultured Piscinibacter sp. TaxID=1131835 RepID=UPI0026397B38|nr:glycosyltransferase [uncultured Piscinibacter sp.]